MTTYQFADFELNEESRQLRCRGREVALQPRAFDLLAYLVNNRSRVVDKDELLESLWPDVIVTDSSLQRAVSLVRSALRAGGLDDAIRTHAGRGYRFTAQVVHGGPDEPLAAGHTGPLDEAGKLFDQGEWSEAASRYEQADRTRPLPPDELEKWGTALQCAGRAPAAAGPLARAAEAYSTDSKCRDAARAVIALARIHFEMGEPAVARGCLRRAEAMLQDVPLCEQHGHLAWINSWIESHSDDTAGMSRHAENTIDIARQLGDPGLEAMGLLFRGIALQASGDTLEGLALQDEAGAMVLTGCVAPLLGGIVYCGLIAGCCNTGDWPRAGQWSESFTHWCERTGMRRFSGSCLLHRVEVFIARGELQRALDEMLDCDETFKTSGLSTVGDARRCLGDVHLLRGELDQAEDAYRQAYENGASAQPGYSLLLHRRGEPEAAIRGLRRSIEDPLWSSSEKVPLFLAFAAMIAGQSGNLEAAEAFNEELDSRPESWAAGTTRGHVLRAKAELHLAWFEPSEAVSLFREALRVYQEMDAPLEAAATRVRLAEALHLLVERDYALLELASAEKVFTRCEASLYLEDCAALRARVQQVEQHG